MTEQERASAHRNMIAKLIGDIGGFPVDSLKPGLIADVIMATLPKTQAASDAQWHDIKTAPKDGREVLLWLGSPWGRVEKARWYAPWSNWQCGAIPSDPAREECSGIGSAVPTHWRNLPNKPITHVINNAIERFDLAAGKDG